MSNVIARQHVQLVIADGRSKIIIAFPGTQEHRGLEQFRAVSEKQIIQRFHVESSLTFFSADVKLRSVLPFQLHENHRGLKAAPTRDPIARIEHAETFFASLGATIKHGGNRAYYAQELEC
jgi:hypothetical protein